MQTCAVAEKTEGSGGKEEGKKRRKTICFKTSPYLHNLPKANEAAQGVRVIVISVWERQKDR